MGVGGLLMEIPTRPQPRDVPRKRAPAKVWAVLLAAGQSRRMGAANKLLARFDGTALARRTAERVMASRAAGTVAVLGHEADRLGETLSGLDIAQVENEAYATGLASSLKAGIGALPSSAAGALVVLADMPELAAEDFNRLIDAFAGAEGRAIVRATHGGKRGNPVILPRALFGEVARLEGDTGARQIVESAPMDVIDVEIGRAASLDVDTPEAMSAAGGDLGEGVQ